MSKEELARLVFASRRGFDQAIIDLGTRLLEGQDVREVSKLVRFHALSLAEITHEIDRTAVRERQACGNF